MNIGPFSSYGKHCSVGCGARDECTSKKRKSTKSILYGDENFVSSEKAAETCKRLLEENPLFWKDRNDKSKSTYLAKCGVEHPMKPVEFK